MMVGHRLVCPGEKLKDLMFWFPWLQAAMGTMDGIINTVSANVPMAPLFGLLKPNGKMIMVGLPDKPIEVPAFALVASKSFLINHRSTYSWLRCRKKPVIW